MKNKKNIKNKEQGNDEDTRCKKTFDKKKYRLQKYSNKYKINQWEERRKKAVLHGFYKELRKSQQSDPQTSSNLENAADEATSKSKKKGYAFHKAKQEYLRKADEKKKRLEEVARMKAEREEALRRYRNKKIHNFKVLSKKTKKGQPVMKGRIEMLLEKIQQSVT